MRKEIFWKKFEKTGLIEDYLRYRKMCNIFDEYNEEIGVIEGDNIGEVGQSKRDSD